VIERGLPVGAYPVSDSGCDEEDKSHRAVQGLYRQSLSKLARNAVKLQFAHGLQYLMAFHQAIFLMLS